MRIRPAHNSDIIRLHEIRTAVRENALSNPALISPADYEEFLSHRGKGWVCEIDNMIVGFAICDLQEENIWALFVHPEFEKRGVAKALQKEMLDWYFTQKENVWLGTAPGTRAEHFYRVSGWRENGMHGKEIKFELTRAEWQRNKAE
jgi:GNAT superfamily N-acetyltransferase